MSPITSKTMREATAAKWGSWATVVLVIMAIWTYISTSASRAATVEANVSDAKQTAVDSKLAVVNLDAKIDRQNIAVLRMLNSMQESEDAQAAHIAAMDQRMKDHWGN